MFNKSLYVEILKFIFFMVILGCVFLRKFNIGFLNLKEFENGFWVFLLNRFFGLWFVEEIEEFLYFGSGFFCFFDVL